MRLVASFLDPHSVVRFARSLLFGLCLSVRTYSISALCLPITKISLVPTDTISYQALSVTEEAALWKDLAWFGIPPQQYSLQWQLLKCKR
jgi:hypothetical protein